MATLTFTPPSLKDLPDQGLVTHLQACLPLYHLPWHLPVPAPTPLGCLKPVSGELSLPQTCCHCTVFPWVWGLEAGLEDQKSSSLQGKAVLGLKV